VLTRGAQPRTGDLLFVLRAWSFWSPWWVGSVVIQTMAARRGGSQGFGLPSDGEDNSKNWKRSTKSSDLKEDYQRIHGSREIRGRGLSNRDD
jgi:hypothetical protein